MNHFDLRNQSTYLIFAECYTAYCEGYGNDISVCVTKVIKDGEQVEGTLKL